MIPLLAGQGRLSRVGDEPTTLLRRALIALTLIVLVAASAGIGLLVANWPQCVRYFAGN